MNRYAIAINGKTVGRISAEDAESAADEYSEKIGFIRGMKMLDANTGGIEWAIIKTDGGDITAERI